MHLILGMLLAGVSAGTPAGAQDCMRWVLRADVGDPGPQARHAMAYNRDRGTTCLVSSGNQPDVWEYDGRRWVQVIVDGPLPPARQDAGLAYDPVRKVLLLVGGLGRVAGSEILPPALQPKDPPLRDVWAFHFTGDGRGYWSREADMPPDGRLDAGARLDCQVVFDDASGRVVLYGATVRTIIGWLADSDIHAWDGVRWTRTVAPETDVVMQNALAYDSRRRRVLSYGGLADIYDPVEKRRHWTAHGRLSTVGLGSITALAVGPQRLGHRMAYDSRRDRLVVFGGAYLEGSTSVEERPTRLYSTPHLEFVLGQDPIAVANPVLPGPTPDPRSYHGMVYDERRGVTVVYGGLGGVFGLGPSITNTWELGAAPMEFVRQPPARVDSCIDMNTGTFLNPPVDVSVEVASSTFIRYRWRRQGVPLDGPAWAGARFQLNGTTLGWMWPSGFYDVVASTECGTELVSTPMEVRVYVSPAVTLAPTTQRVCPGETATAVAGGVAQYETSEGPNAPWGSVVVRQDPAIPVGYAWQRLSVDARGEPVVGSGVAVPGATQSTLRLTDMQPADSGFYRCVITAGCGRIGTSPIELTAGVWVRVQPRSTTNTVCQPVSLGVAASGKGTLRYRWRRNRDLLVDDGRITGTTAPELRIGSLRYLDDAEYDCVITDDCHSVTSRVAAVSVQPNPPFVTVATNGPSARVRGGMVYDSTRGLTVMFGGQGEGLSVPEVYRQDTWEYDGTNWTRRTTAQAPSGRTDFGMAFDRHRGRVVLFGGMTHNGIVGNLRSGETWEFDGTDWSRKSPRNAPAPRNGCTLFYDPVRRVTTLYGGDTELANPRAGDIWTWDGEDWTRVEVTGPRPLFGGVYGSPPRPQMVWDEAHGHAVLPPVTRSGEGLADRATWTWDGARWTEHPYVFAGFGNTPAQAGAGLGLVYDRFRREVVYWSGDGFDQEFLWRWNGSGWRRDDIGSVVGWSIYAQAAYDERRNSIVQFGGNQVSNDPALRGLSSHTSERLLADEPVVLRQPVVHADPRTGGRSIRVVAAGAPPLAYEWQRNGLRLTNAPSLSGVTNATLLLEAGWAADAGSFRCVVRGRCGEVVSAAVGWVDRPALTLTPLSAPVGGQPGLSIQWAEPGAILETAPDPAGPWTVVPGATSPFSDPARGAAGFYRLRQ